MYNTSLNCPPYSPTSEETQEILDLYEDAILIQSTNNIAIS
jgi:predicted metal-binding protein